jgi:hypothetical protein
LLIVVTLSAGTVSAASSSCNSPRVMRYDRRSAPSSATRYPLALGITPTLAQRTRKLKSPEIAAQIVDGIAILRWT